MNKMTQAQIVIMIQRMINKKDESDSEEGKLLYQFEMFDGESVFSCKLCNECFDFDTIEKHSKNVHGKVVTRKQ